MKTLLLCTVREFFRQRAGFFLVLLFLIFGFLTSREHYAFARFFLTDPWGMVSLFVLWTGYTLLCAQFVNHQFTQPECTFLHGARVWPSQKRMYRLGVMAIGFIQPLLYYGIYVLFVAVQEGVLFRTLPLFGFWLVLSLGLMGVTEWRLRHPDVGSSARKAGIGLPFRRPVSGVFWILEWMLRERGLTLLLTKLGATLFVLATLVYDRTGDYDLRLPAIGFTLAYLMNAGLSNELYYWESQVWLWGRSLPVSLTKQFLIVLLLHAVLLLPETLFALRDGGSQFSLWEWVQLYSLGVSCIMLHHARLYQKKVGETARLEATGTSLFAGYVVITFVILYRVPLWGISLVLFACADWIWFREKRR